jgi:hypothetical protein
MTVKDSARNSICMTLSLDANVHPNLSTLRSPAGFNGRPEFDVEGARSDAAPVHRAEHPDIADRIETEAALNASFQKLDDASNRGFRIDCLDKIEVAFGFRHAQVGYDSLVDAVRIHDDLALGR